MVLVAFNQIVMLTGYADPAETFVTCPSQDVVYGAGCCALDTGPVIFRVPDFGGRFWVCCRHDGRTEEFSRIGKQVRHRAGGSTCWLARTGAVRLLRCHGGGAVRRGCSRPRVCS